MTNNHVVEGASEITIRLHGSKQTYKAKVIARAPDYDLALLRAEGVAPSSIKPLPLPLGDSDKLDVGLKAIAMGAPFNLDFSVSEGIISSLERQVPVGSREVVQPVIQTDAAINPGNSGGPLLSSAGEVIGVNTQILTGGAGQSAGVGFAIPINTVKRLLPQLQAGQGGVVSPPSLGVVFTDLGSLPPEQLRAAGLPTSGALIQKVYPGSPAAAAGGTARRQQRRADAALGAGDFRPFDRRRPHHGSGRPAPDRCQQPATGGAGDRRRPAPAPDRAAGRPEPRGRSHLAGLPVSSEPAVTAGLLRSPDPALTFHAGHPQR